MKGSAFKLGNVATKSALKDMKWWNTLSKGKNDKSKEIALAHNKKHTTGEDSEHATFKSDTEKDNSGVKMKSPLEQQLAASNIEQEKLLGNTPVSSGGDFSVMTPAWVGDPEAHKDIDKKQKRLRELWETYSQGTSSDAESKEYEDLSDELKEYDRQWNQSQEDLSGGHIGEGGEGSISAGWPVAWNRKEEMEGE